MYKQIYKTIKNYNNIVIARHVSIDPDAMASQIALRDSIKLSFPEKTVYACGNGTVRFNYMGKLDKNITFDNNDKVLLIVVDTPDRKRVDIDDSIKYDYSIKIDHHPYIETFCDIELIDDTKSSAAEMVFELINSTKLVLTKEIAQTLYTGMVSDTNRFLFNNSSSTTFLNVSKMLEQTSFDITKSYTNLYRRPFSELMLFAYMIQNMKITDYGVGYVRVSNEVISKYQLDTVSTGGLINEFNNTDELLVWLVAMEDVKNSCIKISIRSKGPIINEVAERYNGGGHKMASGAKIPSFEELGLLVRDLDHLCKKYLESSDCDENY